MQRLSMLMKLLRIQKLEKSMIDKAKKELKNFSKEQVLDNNIKTFISILTSMICSIKISKDMSLSLILISKIQMFLKLK